MRPAHGHEHRERPGQGLEAAAAREGRLRKAKGPAVRPSLSTFLLGVHAPTARAFSLLARAARRHAPPVLLVDGVRYELANGRGATRRGV